MHLGFKHIRKRILLINEPEPECNKNSFKLHLNMDIETSQLILLLRTFQIRALMLLKSIAPGSTLSS